MAWDGTHQSSSNNGVGDYTLYNFNNHTDEGTYPRLTWGSGIAKTGDDWELRRDKTGTWTSEGYGSSPILWDWTAFVDEMDVGFYVGTGTGYVGRVELYRTDGTFVTDTCNVAMDVDLARMRLNKNQIDGTPGWFFEAVVRHELGHVFGLCEAQGTDYKKSVMFPPHANDLIGSGGCYPGPPYDCESLSSTSDPAKAAPWPQYPPWSATATTSDPDYGSSSCPSTGTMAGTRCIYGV